MRPPAAVTTAILVPPALFRFLPSLPVRSAFGSNMVGFGDLLEAADGSCHGDDLAAASDELGRDAAVLWRCGRAEPRKGPRPGTSTTRRGAGIEHPLARVAGARRRMTDGLILSLAPT